MSSLISFEVFAFLKLTFFLTYIPLSAFIRVRFFFFLLMLKWSKTYAKINSWRSRREILFFLSCICGDEGGKKKRRRKKVTASGFNFVGKQTKASCKNIVQLFACRMKLSVLFSSFCLCKYTFSVYICNDEQKYRPRAMVMLQNSA